MHELNPENFDLLDYIGQDSSSPLEEVPRNEAEREKQKDDALYSQMQIGHIIFDEDQPQGFHRHHGLHFNEIVSLLDEYPTEETINDFANVPSFTGPVEMDHGYVQQSQSVSLAGRPSLANHSYANLDNVPHIPSTSRGMVQMQPLMVKEEPSEFSLPQNEDVKVRFTMDASSRASSVASSTYTSSGLPTVGKAKPRKYQMKPECEKSNPTYRWKRQKVVCLLK